MLENYTAQLTKKTRLASNVYLFHFQLIKPKTINFKPGQYLMVKVNDQSRLYSICSSNFIKDGFHLVIEIIKGGLASTYFENLKIGERVFFQGPAGVFTLKDNDRDKIFLATGTGIAPIKSMIISSLQSQKRKEKYFLFWGLKKREDVYFFDRFKKLKQENPNFVFKICLSREKDLRGLAADYFLLGHINDGLRQLWDNLTKKKNKNNFDYYLCGSRQMVPSTASFLQEQGIGKENIFLERF